MCEDCPKRYVDQTERKFKVRYKEHIEAIRTNKNTSKYAQLILGNKQFYGLVAKAMKIQSLVREDKHRDTLQKFYSYKISKKSI
jgi:hypothetical protein